MKARQSVRSNLRYGRQLVKSGVSGLSQGRDAHLNGRPVSEVLGQSLRASLGLATLGACAGLLRYCLPTRRGWVCRRVRLEDARPHRMYGALGHEADGRGPRPEMAGPASYRLRVRKSAVGCQP
jgi:hypothetical protein